MTNLTDKEILDFVRENLLIDKDDNGRPTLKEVLCSIDGNVRGDVNGYIDGNVVGDVVGHVSGDVV